MNRLGNLLGYRLGSDHLTGPVSDSVSGSVSTPVGGSVSDSGTESPHVRAIASRPVPSLPIQTKPNRLAWTTPQNSEDQNGQTLISVSAEVAREARTHGRARGAAA